MIKREDIKPGLWITQNLLKNQNDYRVMRVERIDENSKVHFKGVRFGKSFSGDRAIGCRIISEYKIHLNFLISEPNYALLKNANKRYKRMTIEALFKI